mgnify:CR=1 FL=1
MILAILGALGCISARISDDDVLLHTLGFTTPRAINPKWSGKPQQASALARNAHVERSLLRTKTCDASLRPCNRTIEALKLSQ